MRKQIRAPFDTPAVPVPVRFRVVTVIILYIDIIHIIQIRRVQNSQIYINITNPFYECIITTVRTTDLCSKTEIPTIFLDFVPYRS